MEAWRMDYVKNVSPLQVFHAVSYLIICRRYCSCRLSQEPDGRAAVLVNVGVTRRPPEAHSQRRAASKEMHPCLIKEPPVYPHVSAACVLRIWSLETH